MNQPAIENAEKERLQRIRRANSREFWSFVAAVIVGLAFLLGGATLKRYFESKGMVATAVVSGLGVAFLMRWEIKRRADISERNQQVANVEIAELIRTQSKRQGPE